MATVFEKPKSLTDAPFHYCPGCPHGIIHRLVAEVMDELDIEGKAIGVAPATVSQYLSGRAQPSLATLSKLCAVLDCSADDILKIKI